MTVLSGILDVVTFVNYRVFASKQTGNVLFVACNMFSNTKLRTKIEQNVVISLLSFCAGNYIFGRFAHQSHPRNRRWLLSTTLIQAVPVFTSCLFHWTSPSAEITSASALTIVALLAFAASGQTSMAVSVGLAELNTTMVTGAIIATLNDPKVFSTSNAARNRRLLYISCYATGCIVGAVINFGATGSLLFVSAMKQVVSASFLLNKGRPVGRFVATTGSGDDNYEMATPVAKAPLTPWRD